MVRVNVQSIVEYLSSDMRKALEEAVVRTVDPEPEFDRDELFREFVVAVGRNCSTYSSVPDLCVRQ